MEYQQRRTHYTDMTKIVQAIMKNGNSPLSLDKAQRVGLDSRITGVGVGEEQGECQDRQEAECGGHRATGTNNELNLY